MSETVTADMIRQALENTYSPPEWYLGFEVGNSTGARCRRHADAVAINAYPSRGYETQGFEIKVSKSDLAAELKNGIKSDEIARFCDYWFLVTPQGLSDGFTLPPTWGVLEYCDGKLAHKVKAEKLEKVAVTTGFLCAMLRGRERMLYETAVRITAEREEQIKRNSIWGAGNAERELEELREKLDEIKAATGISLDTWTPTQAVISRLKAADSLNIITQTVRDIEHAAKRLTRDAQEIQAAADAITMKGEVK